MKIGPIVTKIYKKWPKLAKISQIVSYFAIKLAKVCLNMLYRYINWSIIREKYAKNWAKYAKISQFGPKSVQYSKKMGPKWSKNFHNGYSMVQKCLISVKIATKIAKCANNG